LRAGVLVADRDGAESAYRRLGGGRLPDETALRAHFHDSLVLRSAPLRLGPEHGPFRVRILFAGGLTGEDLAYLTSVWRMAPARDEEQWRAGVVGVGRRKLHGDLYAWELRQISRSRAWCVDLTGLPAEAAASPVTGSLLRELRATVRQRGLIPVTIERMA
jgi:hypothetical protein